MRDYRYYEPPASIIGRGNRTTATKSPPDEPGQTGAASTPRNLRRPGARDVRILLADDHAVVREGIARLLPRLGHDGHRPVRIHVVAQARDVAEAVALARHHHPDVVVLEIPPSRNWRKSVRRLRERCPSVAVIALTANEDKAVLQSVLKAGGTGYVLKRSPARRLVEAIAEVAAGRQFIDPAALADAVPAPSAPPEQSDNAFLAAPTLSSPLSAREEEILRLAAWGWINREIAAHLFLGVKSVETHKGRGLRKIGVTSRVELMRYALRQGWLRDMIPEGVRP